MTDESEKLFCLLTYSNQIIFKSRLARTEKEA